jgi:nucleotide-binding universal stress UspA family protein
MLPIKTLLHPTDFSDQAATAFQLACALARDYRARLVVLHAARSPVIAPVGGAAPPGVEVYQEELTEKLKGLQLAAPEVCVEPWLLLEDDPAAAILRVAREVGCDLIVLGTHGRTGLRRVLLGSVAEQVMRQAACPVVAVKTLQGVAMPPIRTVLHPTDFSERSDYAFRLACSLARDYGARLLLVHVTPTVVVSGEVVTLPPQPPDVWKALQEQLANLRPPDPNVSVGRHLKEGDPATEILRLAREAKVDVIVMGTHGRTGFGRLLLGSVAEQVVRRAPCPVVTVKAPLPEAGPPGAPGG